MARTATLGGEASFSHPAPAGAGALKRKRRQDFVLFKRVAREFFRAPPMDEQHRRMTARSGYAVAFDGEAAASAPEPLGCDARAVEAFYGEHRLDGYRALAQERLKAEWRDPIESGASLLYAQGDDGVVSVFLHPAETPGMKAEEDAILLARYQELEAMTGRGALERHWRALRAYAETTSLDGEPRWDQILLVRWLRFSRTVVVDGRRRAAPMIGAIESALRFSAAVLLCAWAIGAAF